MDLGNIYKALETGNYNYGGIGGFADVVGKQFDTLSAQQQGVSLPHLNKKGRKKLAEWKKAKAKQELQAKTDAMQDYQYARAEKSLKTGISGVEKAYDEAKLQAARGAEQARQSVRDYGKAQGAQVAQSMASRGLSGTTVQDQAQRAVTADVARNLGAIDTSLAAQQGELGIAKAGAKQAGLGQLAAMYPQLAGMKTETMFNMMKALQSPPKQKKTPWYKKALGAVGSIVGNAIAPGIGSAIGAGFGSLFGGGGGGYGTPGTWSTEGEVFQGPKAP